MFQESWDPLRELKQELDRNEPVDILCTGGNGCVKVSAYLKQRLGFTDVRRLQHGIVGYQQWLADLPAESSIWEGSNFLFEKRSVEEIEEEDSKQKQ
jgi:predicted sulfurtransferase